MGRIINACLYSFSFFATYVFDFIYVFVSISSFLQYEKATFRKYSLSSRTSKRNKCAVHPSKT